MKSLEKFTKLGFTFQEPSKKDKTWFFVKHTEKGGHIIQLWITLRKRPVVELLFDGSLLEPDPGSMMDIAINEFLMELGYTEYIFKR